MFVGSVCSVSAYRVYLNFYVIHVYALYVLVVMVLTASGKVNLTLMTKLKCEMMTQKYEYETLI